MLMQAVIYTVEVDLRQHYTRNIYLNTPLHIHFYIIPLLNEIPSSQWVKCAQELKILLQINFLNQPI